MLKMQGHSADFGAQCLPFLTIALSIVSSLRMHATSATFFGLPASTNRR